MTTKKSESQAQKKAANERDSTRAEEALREAARVVIQRREKVLRRLEKQ